MKQEGTLAKGHLACVSVTGAALVLLWDEFGSFLNQHETSPTEKGGADHVTSHVLPTIPTGGVFPSKLLFLVMLLASDGREEGSLGTDPLREGGCE